MGLLISEPPFTSQDQDDEIQPAVPTQICLYPLLFLVETMEHLFFHTGAEFGFFSCVINGEEREQSHRAVFR